ncbi:DUF5085 family protein [Paenibacillus sp. IHBB 3054]|uniref:DUF5085 family protein n=1 Tax=Paenibacillus sp. IHBB 3054 TaxID=3425689 RepID=UPI003F6625FC
MVNPKDSIKYTSVISRKYHFYYKDLEQHLSDFMSDVFKLKATIKGPLFYSINNIPLDELMHAEFFIPIQEDYLDVTEDMHFHSYFCIDRMISTCDLADYEASTETAYGELLHYMESNYLRQTTPIFHIVSGDRTLPYVFIKIGVSAQSAEEIWL